MVYPLFHVSMLQCYFPDKSYMISMDSINFSLDLTYVGQPMVILDRQVRKLRTKEIDLVKVQRCHRPKSKATWEI